MNNKQTVIPMLMIIIGIAGLLVLNWVAADEASYLERHYVVKGADTVKLNKNVKANSND